MSNITSFIASRIFDIFFCTLIYFFNMKITDWSIDDRPREKMLMHGEETLSNAELLAILINTGQQGRTAVDIAREILDRCHGSLERLHHELLPLSDHKETLRGIGPAKGCTLRAALELGRRLEKERQLNKFPALTLNGSDALFALFDQQLSHLDHEELWAVYASRSGRILQTVLIGEGGIDGAPADVRKIVRPALQYQATNVALCHNHPHSLPHPSQADLDVTRQVAQALALFNISLVDHVIIADGTFYSFRANGNL